MIQCRPCGHEWQPCCAVLDSLCGDGFMCYAEQDRCVVPEYADVKEEFFPDCALPPHDHEMRHTACKSGMVQPDSVPLCSGSTGYEHVAHLWWSE